MFWQSWSTEAFQRAHASGRPVLVWIATGWSAACAEMEANVFAQPAVAAAIEAAAVPVRVDADLRPDIAERYGLGGWPTTVWLTPDGEMLTGGTYVDAEVLIATLADVASRYQRDRVALVQQTAAARAQRRAAREAPAEPPITLEEIRTRIVEDFDEAHAGFGQEAKFPLAAPILFALRAGIHAGDADLLHVATLTLDRIATSALTDKDTGAFYRNCANRDWTDPDHARLLDVQAEMIGIYLEAAHLLHNDAYRDRALAALEYVDRELRDGPHRAYRHYPAGPILTDSNARLIRTLVHATNVLGDTRWLLAAVDIAEHLIPIVYARASGVAHCLRTQDIRYATDTRDAADRGSATGDPRRARPVGFGLLADAILMASALLDLGEAAGQGVYVELAEELTRWCVRRFWDSASGAFVDRLKTTAGAGDVGLLGEPLWPFGGNVEAARLVGRMAGRTQDVGLVSCARDVQRYVGATAWREGILSSDYGLLLLEGLVVHSDSGG